jgi:hypothetical protein
MDRHLRSRASILFWLLVGCAFLLAACYGITACALGYLCR